MQDISPKEAARITSRAKVLSAQFRAMRRDLVDLRRRSGLRQQDIAALLGVSKQAVQKLERYDADPKLSTLARYANAVGGLVDIEVLEDRGQSVLLATSPWDRKTVVSIAGDRHKAKDRFRPEWAA